MKLYSILTLLLLWTKAICMHSQIQGTVQDQQGTPLPGALVKWTGTHKGVMTDGNGRFSISRSGDSRILSVSYVGYVKDSIRLSETDSTAHFVLKEMAELGEATVTAVRSGTYKSFNSIENVDMIPTTELCRAACCNLGESFVTNPSVDVSYSDAATGAKQIRLLGLSGTYVQMLTENIPNFRIAAAPYGLGYVPGPWMQSIQVSKGISSVKNGYEALTGQINVEFKKPQQPDPDWVAVNLFGDNGGRIEGNADATFQVGKRWGTTLLGHYEKETKAHDSNNDGFIDIPQVEQYNFINRWTYSGDKYVFQGGIKALKENRHSGQMSHATSQGTQSAPYLIDIATDRYEAFTKNAYIFNKEHNTNLALILNGSWHKQYAVYGYRTYDLKQSSAYASLLFETEFSKSHSLSTGLSFNYDGLSRRYRLEHNALVQPIKGKDEEKVAGAYAQYTFNLNDVFLAMAGIRTDYSDIFGTFVTPRAHIKFSPTPLMSFRLSAGKGYRTAHIMDENNYLFSGSRKIIITDSPLREEAWNYGAAASLKFPIAGKMLNINLEYYYTDFSKQAVADMDSDPHAIMFYALEGRSYSQVAQAEISYPFFKGFTMTAAYRYTDARTTYGGQLRERPLTNRYKALLTASYKTPLELWQFDATLQLNGGGRMPTPYTTSDNVLSWSERYRGYLQLSAQITRYFRNWSIYAGGENLTNFKQKNPIIDAANPWGNNFDPTMIWGPTHGTKIYVGLRFNLPR